MPGLTRYFATPQASSRGVVVARLADGRYLVRAAHVKEVVIRG